MPLLRPHVRLALALAVLLVAVLPERATVIDDLYISYAYALSLLDRGQLTYGTLRVEGYSNFSWVLGLAAARAAHLPITYAAKVGSLAASGLLLAGVHARAPRSAAGTVLLLVVAGWSAVGAWAGRGMETPLFSLLVWHGWGRVAEAWTAPEGSDARRAWTAACVYLAAAALTRPEGSIYLTAAVLLAGGRVGRGWSAVAAVGAWHAWRWAYFGSLVPLPILAKSAPSPDVWLAPRQIGAEWLTALPVFAAALATWRPTRRVALLAAAPVALHVTMLLRMHGDWMGDTRIQLPGIVAGLAALAFAAPVAGGTDALPSRSALLPGPLAPVSSAVRVVTVLRWTAVIAALPMLAYAPSRLTGLQARLPRLTEALRRPDVALDAPLVAEARFVVHAVPDGGTIESGDIGVLGLIPDLRIQDSNGLVDALRARTLAGLEGPEGLDARFRGRDAPDCVRRLPGDVDARSPQFRARLAGYRAAATIEHHGRRHTWWCRRDLAAPSADTVRARWAALTDRLPELAAFRWHAARALADGGDAAAAEALYAVDPWVGADAGAALLIAEAPLPDMPDGAGYRLAAGERLRTHALPREAGLSLRVDGPPGVALDATWRGSDGNVVSSEPLRTPATIPVNPPVPGARLEIARGVDAQATAMRPPQGRGPRGGARFVQVRAERSKAARSTGVR